MKVMSIMRLGNAVELTLIEGTLLIMSGQRPLFDASALYLTLVYVVKQSAGKRVGPRPLRTPPVCARLLLCSRGPNRRPGGASDEGRGGADQLCAVVSSSSLCSPRRDWLDRVEDPVSPQQR